MCARVEQVGALVAAARDRSRPPLLMGVLNVTPDSFSDGGRFSDPDAAIRHGLEMAGQGADLLDVGGESTRPGASGPGADEEIRRVIPVIRALAERCAVPISIDTRRAAVARAALDNGAAVVNDVSGFRFDPDMPALLGREHPVAIAMHMRGEPSDMMTRTRYDSLVGEVLAELWTGVDLARTAGLPADRLWIDPGFGFFAKDAAQNVALLAALPAFVATGLPVVAGLSRKAFLGRLTGRTDPAERRDATVAAVALATFAGARIVRVHDVGPARDATLVAHAALLARAEVAP